MMKRRYEVWGLHPSGYMASVGRCWTQRGAERMARTYEDISCEVGYPITCTVVEVS